MSVDIVRSVKNSLVDSGFVLSGPDGAFEITKRVAFLLGLGVLSKPTGNNAGGFAVDIVMARDGRIWDILIDSGGANEPSWNEQPAVDPSRYRDSPWVDPTTKGTLPAAPPATPPPAPNYIVDPRMDIIIQRLTDLQMQLNEVLRTQTPPAPSYAGSIWGIKVVLRPV